MNRTYTKDITTKVGEQVMLQGWVDTIRDHGQLIFVDLRDSKGFAQLVFNDDTAADVLDTAKKLGKEFVVKAIGTVKNREASLVNTNIETGSVEIAVESLEIHSESKSLPFPIDTDGREIDEMTRLKYRYIDMRRPRIQQIMKQKAGLINAVRNWMHEQEFLEVTTPLLTSTSPEGARDFVVPSRLQPGKFFVLPQAPQQFKQLLMVGGVDRYFQIAPCARDEDPRADRHAGIFYQIDIEISFPTQDIIFDVAERMIQATYKTVAPHKEIMQFPFPRIPYKQAIAEYGSDKPDIRFGYKLQDATAIVKDKTEFNVFNNAEVVKALVVAEGATWTRTEIDQLEAYAKEQGAGGLAYFKIVNGELESGIAKFMQPIAAELKSGLNIEGDAIVLFAADKEAKANKVLGLVRLQVGEMLGLRDPNKLAFVWITDFPFYEVDDKTGKLDFGHNPFSMPQGGAAAFDQTDPLDIQSHQYDLALNGYEIMSGSIRNHDSELLVKAFEKVGYSRAEVEKRFGALHTAFQYGVPPHGGWAIGIDRFFMVLVDEPNIRDTYAFPMAANGTDVLMNAPSDVREEDLKVLGIQIRPEILAKQQAQQV